MEGRYQDISDMLRLKNPQLLLLAKKQQKQKN